MPFDPDAERPNILWISFEDTSPRYGCYGDELARTPTIDRLAAEGCRYPNTFAVAGVCAPARHAVITGMYPTFTGAHHMRTTHQTTATPELPTPYDCVPPHYVRCFSEHLRAAGYFCTNNRKTDYQFEPPLSAWDELSTEAHWRHRPDPDQPFFAVFNKEHTHESGMWDVRWDGRELQTDPAKVAVPPYLPDTPRVREAIARQYDNIAADDEWAAGLIAQLEADGLLENTIIFHWSDHGEGLPRHKRWPYDTGVRVPMVVRWPESLPRPFEPGAVDERLVSTIDLGPTVLSLAGVDVPRHMQGKPFVGPAAEPRDRVYATRDRYDTAYDMVRAVRDDRFKYLRNYYPHTPRAVWLPYRDRQPTSREMWRLEAEGKLQGPQRVMFEPRPAEELYDTRADPHEIDNLAGDPAHAETLARMRAKLDELLDAYDRFGDMDEAAMKRQWWAGETQPTTAMPRAFAYNADEFGQEPVAGGQLLQAPVLVKLHCPTQGGSIVWTLDPADEPAHWNLSVEPIRFTEPGDYVLQARAHRIGFKPSPTLRLNLRIV